MRLVLVQDALGWKWKSIHTIRSLVDRTVVMVSRYEDHELFGEAYRSIMPTLREEKTVFVGGCSCGWAIQGQDTNTVVVAQRRHRVEVGEFSL